MARHLEQRLSIRVSSVFFTFESIRHLNQTFTNRIGDADQCTSALGHVTVGFSWLEQSLERHIGELAQVSAAIAPVLTSEMSFKVKVAVLSSLVRSKPPLRQFNVGDEDFEEVWNDILKMLFKCEEMRNQLLHSHWSLAVGDKMRRTKTSAKPARGLHIFSEDLTADYLLDVYDYILNVDCVLADFFRR